MHLDAALADLRGLGTDQMRAHNLRRGLTGAQYGVKMGAIRTVAKKIKSDHALGLNLWDSGNLDARLLAVLVLTPKDLAADRLAHMVAAADFAQLADWLNAYVVKKHPDKEALRRQWLVADDPQLARAGWSLTAERIEKSPDGLDLPTLLDRIETEMPSAPDAAQWTMNFCLAGIGIHHPAHRDRALAIGEALGIYRDFPTSKGCTSPFAPIWINEMVRRQT